MPKMGLKQTFKLQTRGRFTEVEAEIGISMDGRELVNMGIVGAALEECIELVQKRIKESYETVPPRPGTTPVGSQP